VVKEFVVRWKWYFGKHDAPLTRHGGDKGTAGHGRTTTIASAFIRNSTSVS
jgi:hypothetical protein